MNVYESRLCFLSKNVKLDCNSYPLIYPLHPNPIFNDLTIKDYCYDKVLESVVRERVDYLRLGVAS